MSGKNRAQRIVLSILNSRIAHLPSGSYAVHVDSAKIEKGSVKLVVRIIDTLTNEDEGEVNNATTT